MFELNSRREMRAMCPKVTACCHLLRAPGNDDRLALSMVSHIISISDCMYVYVPFCDTRNRTTRCPWFSVADRDGDYDIIMSNRRNSSISPRSVIRQLLVVRRFPPRKSRPCHPDRARKPVSWKLSHVSVIFSPNLSKSQLFLHIFNCFFP